MHPALFHFDRPESVATWSAIDDRVMGGVSRSTLRFDPAGHALFAGTVSADNNGGFASVRSAVVWQAGGGFDRAGFDASGYGAIELEVRGDGHRYKLALRTDRSFDGVNYQAGFEPPAGRWTRVRLALADFLPSWRGRPVADAPALKDARIEQLGLMIADRQFGGFELAVRGIWMLRERAEAGVERGAASPFARADASATPQ
jgi:NADH dehydrogenase [ubiquinone] 1 alpha subcomplex assembly factor 1